MKGQWSDLPRRLATVSLGAPAIVIILSHRQTSIIFFQAVHLLCTLEWIRLCPISRPPANESQQADASSPSKTAVRRSATTKCTSTVLFPFLSVFLATSSTCRFPIYLSIAAAILYLSYYLDADDSPKANDDATTSTPTPASIQTSTRHSLHGLLYLSTSFHSWLQLSSQSFTHTIYLLFIVWNSDTGALLGGRIGKAFFSKDDFIGEIVLGRFSYGRRLVRFVKKISPKKSFTGFVGGIVLGVGTALFLPEFIVGMGRWIGGRSAAAAIISGWLEVVFGENGRDYVDVYLIPNGLLDLDHWVPSSSSSSSLSFAMFLPLSSITASVWMRRCILGIILSVFGIMGDMVESAVKRSSGTKDSGKLLPGHGGLLDRFDSTFFAVGIYFHLCMNESYLS